METRLTRLRTQQGMVLVSSLTILAGLMLAGIGAGMMLQNDYRVLANLRGSTEAFYFSAAGLEWGKREIARSVSFPPALSSQTRSFSSGAFAVSFGSPMTAGLLSARIVVRSTGTSREAKHSLQAQITKSYDLADAALVLRGNGALINLSPVDIFLSGADHGENGTPLTGTKPRSAVSTADNAVRSLFNQALGVRQGVLDESAGAPALATSDYLSSAFVAQFAGELCASPAAFTHVVPTPGALILENQVLGNQAAAQLHCVEGLSAPADTVTFAGNTTGTGILVVRNADLVLSGTLRWDGLIIVTGSDVSFKTTGTGLKQLYGAVIVNETGIPGASRKILDFEGTVRIAFSRSALSRTIPLVPSSASVSAYGALPAVILQDYWRAEAS